jgi:hypothetical protein
VSKEDRSKIEAFQERERQFISGLLHRVLHAAFDDQLKSEFKSDQHVGKRSFSNQKSRGPIHTWSVKTGPNRVVDKQYRADLGGPDLA